MAYSLVYPIYVSNGKISIFSFFEVFLWLLLFCSLKILHMYMLHIDHIYSYFCLCVHALFYT